MKTFNHVVVRFVFISFATAVFSYTSSGQSFQSFLSYLNTIPESSRQARVDSFLAISRSYPIVDDSVLAYFVYTGSATSVTVPGDANGWNQASFPMTKVTGTTLWYCSRVFEKDARLDYKFVINGSNWILDPRNPRKVSGGYGPNSELAMPAYIQPPEIVYNAGISHGAVKDTFFFSASLNNSRHLYIYTPAGYTESTMDSFPMILLHDGLEYIQLGSAVFILDNLIAQQRIVPLIAVFVPPVNRNDEYAFSQTSQFMDFIINEVTPFIDGSYRTSRDPARRAMAGVSFGGLISTQICDQHPDRYGLIGLYSSAYWPNGQRVLTDFIQSSNKGHKIYVDWGTYEGSVMTDGRRLRDTLQQRGQPVKWREWHEGHSWGSWRAHLDEALEFFFPGVALDVADHRESQPAVLELHQNYPNPFNPSTTIAFGVHSAAGGFSFVSLRVYNVLGEEVARLLDEEMMNGSYQVQFDGRALTSGVYFCRLLVQPRSGGPQSGFFETRKMVLVK